MIKRKHHGWDVDAEIDLRPYSNETRPYRWICRDCGIVKFAPPGWSKKYYRDGECTQYFDVDLQRNVNRAPVCDGGKA